MNRLRWALCWAILGPTLGHEQGGRRPVLVISQEPFNRHSGLVTVLPLTTARRAPRPWVARLPAGRDGLSVDSLRLTAWSRTLSRERLVLPPLGWVTDPETRRTIAAYRHSEAGYLVERISASAASTRFEHDELGRVVQLTSPAGRVNRFEYDLGGRLTAAVDALG